MRQADRIIVNVIANYGLSLVGGVASLVIIPIVIGDLGPSGYGLAAMLLATFTITEMLGRSIMRAVHRYLPQDLASDDQARVNITFNSALACYVVLGIVAACVIWSVRSWYLDDPNIGPELHRDGTFAFALVCLSLFAGAPLWTYRAALEAIQRFDLVVVHVGLTTIVRALAVITIFKVGYGSVTVFVVSQILAIFVSYLLCRRALRRSLPQVTISLRMIRASAIKLLLSFAAGILLITGGNILGLEGFRILVGKGLSMEAVGGLSAVWALRTLVFLLINNMTNVLTPAVSTMDARGASENVAKLLLSAIKYSAFAAASICIIPLSVAESFLQLWLGDGFFRLVPLMYTVLLAQVPLAMSTSSQQVLLGLGMLKVTGPVIFLRGAGSLAAAGAYLYLVQEPTLLGAAISLYVVQVVFSMFIFMYGSTVVKVGRLRALTDGFVSPLFLAVLAALVTWLLANQIGSDQWWNLTLSIAGGEIVYLVLVITVGLGAEERSRLRDFAGRMKNRLMPGSVDSGSLEQ